MFFIDKYSHFLLQRIFDFKEQLKIKLHKNWCLMFDDQTEYLLNYFYLSITKSSQEKRLTKKNLKEKEWKLFFNVYSVTPADFKSYLNAL